MDRTKRIMTLALNKSFSEKVKNFKKLSKKKKPVETDKDIDFVPCTRTNTQALKKKKVHIISNILLNGDKCKKINDNNNKKNSNKMTESNKKNNEEAVVVYVADILDTIFEKVVNQGCEPEKQGDDLFNSLDNTSFIENIIETILDRVCTQETLLYTKRGEIRKRKKYMLPLPERKRAKLEEKKRTHWVKDKCTTLCKKKCLKKISDERRIEINEQYWQISINERNAFVYSNISQGQTKRKTVVGDDGGPSRRTKTLRYFLPDHKGTREEVCKVFFLSTLGFTAKNDRIIRNAASDLSTKSIKPLPTKKIGNANAKKIDRKLIVDHINSFKPTISHYRREHAPRVRYLPSDITIKFMYKDYLKKYPNANFSYYLYRSVVAEQKISFAKLGHEECWNCEEFKIHENGTGHNRDNLEQSCDKCCNWKEHQEKYIKARKEYQIDSQKNREEGKLIFTADLQKVIMLPRCDMYKEVIFCPRLIAFNETFAPAGSSQKVGPTAILWHEATAGRSKQDIISTFFAFFSSIRDTEHVVLWLDNCSAQNKNWCLYCFFIYLINSNETSLKILELKYFQPGHTFMAADAFHHQVECSLARMGKVYDFQDFVTAVNNASKNVKIIEMEVDKFYNWCDHASQYKLTRTIPRPYLNKMSYVRFDRGCNTLTYREDFDKPDIVLNFLNAKSAKQGITKPLAVTTPRGITAERKKSILSLLTKIMPDNRKPFWENLPTSTKETLLGDDV